MKSRNAGQRTSTKRVSIALLVAAMILPFDATLFAQSAATQPAIAGTQATTRPTTRPRGQRPAPTPPPPTLGLEQGTMEFETPDFTLKLVKASQTIAALQPKGVKGFVRGFNDAPFDFTPADQLQMRQGDRFNHLGDIHFRARKSGDAQWIDFSSSGSRKPVEALPANGDGVLASADLTPTISGRPFDPDVRRERGGDAIVGPLQVQRTWRVDDSGRLVLQFRLINNGDAAVEVGGLGFPVVFNNMINNFVTGRPRSLPEAHETCSFFDPYVGQSGGYLQVTRLSGHGPALLVVPDAKTPTPFEAFRPLNDASPRGQTFEGAFEWTVHSKAYAENEWKSAKQWNPGTARTIEPGRSVDYALRFLLSPGIREIEQTLAANNRPVAVGIPGYIVPTDLEAKLFLDPAGRKITGVTVDPAGALDVKPADAKGRHQQYTVRGKTWGRARLDVAYDDGTTQSVHYNVIKPSREVVDDMGRFLTTKAWFDDTSDPFGRAPSPMTYDRANNRIATQDLRVWVAGLSDEGGVGSWLAAMMKIAGQPNPEEVEKLSQFVDTVIWGGIQYDEGPRKYGVRKSLFFYDPQALPDFKYDPNLRWETTNPQTGEVQRPWTAWNKQASESVDRAYNYPHVAAAYWSMYRIARNNPGLVKSHEWNWYLDQAFNTIKFMTGGFGDRPDTHVHYTNVGLMEGSIFVMILEDLKREGWTEQATYVEAAMRQRADRWKDEAYPFGSEMAWDSTGQEEVFAWTNYFGQKDAAKVSIDSIVGYMPTVPHWGYNGNARRYWDFFYGAAPGGTTERQIHHYGSGLNAIPALTQFREHPSDLHLLRIGYAGTMGALTNIDQDGFPSAAFHSYPQNLYWDAYTGDYGPNFFGHAVNTGVYVIDHPDFGWQAFGGNLRTDGDALIVDTLDSFRQRIYLAPYGLYLTLDAGQFQSVTVRPSDKSVKVTLAPSNPFTPQARLRIEQSAKIDGVGTFAPATSLTQERGAFVLPLTDAPTTLEIKPTP